LSAVDKSSFDLPDFRVSRTPWTTDDGDDDGDDGDDDPSAGRPASNTQDYRQPEASQPEEVHGGGAPHRPMISAGQRRSVIQARISAGRRPANNTHEC